MMITVKKIIWFPVFKVFATIVFILLINNCMKEAPQEISIDIPVFDTEGIIGSDGGIVRIMDENSPIYGCYVEIKEDALDDFVNISIRQVSSPDSTILDSNKIFVEFLPSGTTFKIPAEIGVVYDSGDIDSLQQFVFDEFTGH